MLSIENPPPDPSCPCEKISQLKSSSSDGDKRACDDKPDLLIPGLDDDDDNNKNPVPNFSIRDYVFSSRSKDIKTNWPFSQKNLQLCLNYGLKDLLPPFHPIEFVRNQPNERCAVETSLAEKENIRNSDGDVRGPTDRCVSATSGNSGCNQKKLAVDCVNIGSGGSKGGKQVSLAENSLKSHSDRTHFMGSESNPLPEALAAKLVTSGLSTSQSTNQPVVKNCRLIVKVGTTGSDPCSNRDLAAGCVAFSETMASKVCPVCKNFSSSSNTTLNAHIDRCLSLESTMKWTPDSQVVKHRINPRKTRLVVDIYETAPHCTLEDLDRRNGTNWAMNSRFPTQENVACGEGEKQRVSPVNFKDKGDEGVVYIDANGTKVRILSKFNDASLVPKNEADLGPGKPLKGGRGSKLISTYKKKHQTQKHLQYLKLDQQSKQYCSSKSRHPTEVCGEKEINFPLKEDCMKEESPTQRFKAQEQIKPNDSGTMMKWACSKRTSLLKRHSHREGLQQVGYNFRQELAVGSDQSGLGDSYMERSCFRKTPNSYESQLSSPGSSKRNDTSSIKTPFSEFNEEPTVRKRVGFSSFGSQVRGTERFLEPPQRSVKQLRVDSASGDGSRKDFANKTPYLGKQFVEVNAGSVQNSSRDGCSNLSRSHCGFSSKVATNFSSLRKHYLSVSQSSMPKSKYKLNNKFSSHKKLDKKVVTLPSKVVGKHNAKEKHAENQSRIEGITSKKFSNLKIRRKRAALSISQDEESMPLKCPSECHSHEVGNKVDSSAGVGRDSDNTFDGTGSGRKRFQTHGNYYTVIRPLDSDLGGNATSLSKSLDSEIHKLASPSNGLSGSFQSVGFKRSLPGAETPSCPTNQRFGDEEEMFCADVGTGMDSKDGPGNYFSEVDPIPIPGPPGSYLLSPRDMGSEDLQGNSSITTSRVQSSEDHHDLADRDSSDSPVSAMSTISNSTIPRCDSKSSEKSTASHDAVAENNASVPQATTVLAERINLDESKVNVIVPEKGPVSFRNDQPCCCSRKEGTSQGVSLNFQESQRLRRRILGNQLTCDSNMRPNSLNSVPEVVSLGNFPNTESEKAVLPVTRTVVGPVSVNASVGSSLKSPAYSECDSASPLASNPVLRLMGKNLMVVNRDENVTEQCRPAQSSSLKDHQTPQFQMLSGVSPGNIQNEDFPPFYHMVCQHPIVSSRNQCNPGFEPKLSNSFGSYITSKTPQTSSHATAGVFLGKTQHRNADFNSNPLKEIIIIDDTHDREADNVSAADAPKFDGRRENRLTSASVSIPMASNYNSRHVNPFYSYQPQDSSSSYIGSHMVQKNASFQMPPNLLMASSSSTGHLRSSLYYSPSFS
ncbi:Dentin sialoprotein [Actinidia chinensis var. chinensis]|uniref:Dentin sialoprotein n=1 Tax=Actinidia chinensis var. chinensis TaxID=1590841 RepID=A0A2R6QCX2_ACTCC|nr:Dentin sialoprotein [Actinidia chinensis var. chinensis]